MTTAEIAAKQLNAEAMRNLAAGRLMDAKRQLLEALGHQRDNVSIWLNLASANRTLGDFAGAMEAIEGALRVNPRLFLALLMKASLLDRQGRAHQAGEAYGIALGQIDDESGLDDATRRAVARAREVHGKYQRELEEVLRTSIGSVHARSDSTATARIDGLIEQLVGKRRVYTQQPTHFHLPGLPAIEFYDRAEFSWLPDVEAATRDITAELLGVLDDPSLSAAFVPYINYPDWQPLDQWRELNRSVNWTAFHLLDHGARVEANAARCPKTMALLDTLPQPRVPRRSPAAMFSVLKPRTRIPPHCGVANSRLVVHLPLIVPPGCGFRVGNETREWKVGEAWVFDDTIEHAAWNDSDALRIILIFDIWSPRLSVADREMFALLIDAMDSFNQSVGSMAL